MPQSSDSLPDFLPPARRAALRELFLHRITILSCAYWRNSPPWSVAWRRCADIFLLFPVRGSVRAHLKGRALTIDPGRYLILPEGTPHSLELVEGHKVLHQFALHIHLRDRWQRSQVNRFPSFLGVLGNRKDACQSLSELCSLLVHDPETAQEFGAVLVQSLLSDYLRTHHLPPLDRAAGDPRIERAVEQMEEGFSSPAFSVEQLARSVELTPVQFRKLFHRDIGQSPKTFLQHLRMRRADFLLRHTPAPVKDVAAQCGFASDHYFHLSFRRVHGRTPTEYRQGAGSDV